VVVLLAVCRHLKHSRVFSITSRGELHYDFVASVQWRISVLAVLILGHYALLFCF
jgi:hypothetical protein